MVTTNRNEVPTNYDRKSELKAFDDTKEGVKGLVDAGVTEVPRMFHHPQDEHSIQDPSDPEGTKLSIPVIDLEGLFDSSTKQKEIVAKIGEASETWGFFQIVNHGIPVDVLEEVKNGIRRFFEQDTEVKKQLYSRDPLSNPMFYNSNFDLYSAPAANWRDTFVCYMAPTRTKPEDLTEVCRYVTRELLIYMFLIIGEACIKVLDMEFSQFFFFCQEQPYTSNIYIQASCAFVVLQLCRDILVEYTDQVMKLGKLLFDLLSEALGLKPSHLNDMGCSEGLLFLGHYYPPCPQPELTLGTTKHADNPFLTVFFLITATQQLT